MTPVRPRPTPEQERSPQSHAQDSQTLVSQSWLPLVLAVLYVALLVVPWVLTCKIATEPAFIISLSSKHISYYVQNGWVTSIDVLNSLATVLSLPILSALLARASVVFSQRRRPAQALSLRQLFALADRGWYNLSKAVSSVHSSPLLRLGCLLLFISILLPLIRSGLVSYDNVPISSHWPDSYWWVIEQIGINPSPATLRSKSAYQPAVTSATRTSLRLVTGGIDTNLWPVCNDPDPSSACGFRYGPYDIEQSRLSNFWESADSATGTDGRFETNGSALMHASTLRAGSSIGTYKDNKLGAYALGLKSGTRCENVPARDVEEQCTRSTDNGDLSDAARGWNTSLEIPQQFRLNICYPPIEGDPWESANASPWRPIKFTEHLYVGLDDPDSHEWECSGGCDHLGSSSGLYFHCQADSMMSYFEMGKASTNGMPGRLLEQMPAGFDTPGPAEPSAGSSWYPYFGPLKTATVAMFGNDSWLDMLKVAMEDVEDSNLTIAAAITILCSMRPLGDADGFNDNEACRDAVYPSHTFYETPAVLFSTFVRDMLKQFQTGRRARATLNTATFYANSALLTELTQRADDSPAYKYGIQESDEHLYVPVLSLAAIVTVSILVGVQVVGIVILLVYLYSSKVWTWTLDAIAVARIGSQLSGLDVFLVPCETGTLGPAWLTVDAAKQLEQTDGLVGSTCLTGQIMGHDDIEMATMPPPYAPRGEEPSIREESRLPGTAVAARNTVTSDHLAPEYTPPAEEHTTRAPSGEAEVAGGRGGFSEVAISRAPSSEPPGAVFPTVPSIEALAVGGRGLIPRRGWKKADKPLPQTAAE
ncbi:hypothetical protein KVR01_010842 [Diaporthe batatas]|uniref:uncharacterized protein n=1 Tax=Diaporthe batatas TaxID=748121 RepID=UPI001D03F040|nr:uncharacterized protein KVR01_010842 [Diaporthe batatas]KAG8159181.1 hypothetical protein KVR01_010842 [Diaporthe batatas]